VERQQTISRIATQPFSIAEANMTPEWELRKIRNAHLRECDWTQFADSPLTAEQKQAWATYRQALRDLPANSTPAFDENNQLVGYVLPQRPEQGA
jgi:hypothetical protein